MAEYFFPGPTAGFYGTDGKDGGSISHKEVRKKVFSTTLQIISWKGKPTLLVGEAMWPSVNHSPSLNLCAFRARPGKLMVKRPGGDGGELKKSCPI